VNEEGGVEEGTRRGRRRCGRARQMRGKQGYSREKRDEKKDGSGETSSYGYWAGPGSTGKSGSVKADSGGDVKDDD